MAGTYELFEKLSKENPKGFILMGMNDKNIAQVAIAGDDTDLTVMVASLVDSDPRVRAIFLNALELLVKVHTEGKGEEDEKGKDAIQGS